MKESQKSLKGKWGISIAACLIAGVITIMITILGGYLINEDILSLTAHRSWISFIFS